MLCREKTACFTGHRELKKEKSLLFSEICEVVECLIAHGYLYFGTGGARGFDTLAAEAVLQLKNIYPEIHLILVLPFQNQYQRENDWTLDDRVHYQFLKQKASKVVYTQETYSLGCYYKRNRHLVDFSSVCVCYQYKSTGGTAYTIRYAKKTGVPLIRIS